MQRTPQQNKALHKYLRLLAESLGDAGYDMKELIKIEIKPTAENVKETMFKPVMMALYPDKTSTTELSTTEIQEVYQVLDRATAEKLEIHIPWPSWEEE